MGNLYLMCGVPGVGKSTWCKENVPDNATYVSRDEIRFSLLGKDDSYFSKEKETFAAFTSAIKDGLAVGDVYADATHLNRSSRAKVLNAVVTEDMDNAYALVLTAPLEVCLKRNSGRSGRAYVPENSIEQMFNSFTMPSVSEGFTQVFVKDVSK